MTIVGVFQFVYLDLARVLRRFFFSLRTRFFLHLARMLILEVPLIVLEFVCSEFISYAVCS